LFPRERLAWNIGGTAYRGWQRQQSGVKGVQETLEEGVSRVAKFILSACFCAGRTDAGVACLLSVSSFFETDAVRTAFNWVHVPMLSAPICQVWHGPQQSAGWAFTLASSAVAGAIAM